MITGELRSRIDKLWEEFWTGGIANPLTVIEQITFLMFSRLLDMTETRNERKAALSGGAFPNLFSEDEQELRWSHFKNLGADAMLPLVRDKVFPHFKTRCRWRHLWRIYERCSADDPKTQSAGFCGRDD